MVFLIFSFFFLIFFKQNTKDLLINPGKASWSTQVVKELITYIVFFRVCVLFLNIISWYFIYFLFFTIEPFRSEWPDQQHFSCSSSLFVLVFILSVHTKSFDTDQIRRKQAKETNNKVISVSFHFIDSVVMAFWSQLIFGWNIRGKWSEVLIICWHKFYNFLHIYFL